MKIGYSCWGFLGPGVVDTPDGSHSYRRPLLDTMQNSGHRVTLLQHNRDRLEAGLDLSDTYRFDTGLPTLDVVIFEWRWPMPGRNTTPCGSPGHQCDLHRQTELIEHYTLAGVPTIVWDLDRQLRADPLRRLPNVRVCEPATRPTPGATTILCPVPDERLDAADAYALAQIGRLTSLVYVGNQYNRYEHFDRYFADAAAHVGHRVAGTWTRTRQWPHVNFTGRCAFTDVDPIHRGALATVMLLPDRYRSAGHITQRLSEAVLAGCVPLMPVDVVDGHRFVPDELVVVDGKDVIEKVEYLQRIAGSITHAGLIYECLRYLDHMRLSRQAAALQQVMTDLMSTPE
ncbi:hypothetical protein AB0B10_25540 [Micromonospora arborensis]|uniref:hypothetical protein n=1 Tax=Micromonospora arborensis TaxID=2116518 RepID=UPI0033E62067